MTLDRRGRWWLAVLATLVFVAVGADLLASDLPLIARLDGRTYVLPCLTRPRELVGKTPEWSVRTPIPWGPLQTLASTGELRDEPPPWAPDQAHWLGTDELGRDVAARLVHGARVSLFVAFFTMVIALGIGLLIGGVSGYLGGKTDAVLSRVVEVMQTFPLVFFLIALMAVLRTQSLWPLVIALGLTRWTEVARLVRAEVLSLSTREYVLAARALGASPARIIARHLLPNAIGPVLVVATFGVGSAILLETALSFLGIGVAPPTASWGELLTEAHRTLQHPGAWWLAVFPGLAIAGTVLTVNGLGEALRRVLGADVHTSRRASPNG
ncbi:MAG: peptide ABC transporter permease [Archangium gephyra]|uniref:Peptide ABC transporter permease n=1 Tax=Archangium gephyra TaxID=48 RepID=A0A2W5TQ33_9BACT|nr:MAG: peptide ABC transporter permease [Archangium gephyra]